MAVEIERKFLVKTELWNSFAKGNGMSCIQTYLSTDINKTIRIRVMGDKAFITIKGKTEHLSRAEFEYEIPIADGNEMIKQFGDKLLEKTRYIIPYQGHDWEVDEFKGDNTGLVIAEIELTAEDETFEKPIWLAEEVSHDARYFNSCLQDNPYSNWKNL